MNPMEKNGAHNEDHADRKDESGSFFSREGNG
jgi:hypothetical protein